MTPPPRPPANPTLIRVFEIPRFGRGYIFGAGREARFIERDWFHDAKQDGSTFVGAHLEGETFPDSFSVSTEEGREKLAEMIMGKTYYDPDKAYLVLCPLGSFTINYDAAL